MPRLVTPVRATPASKSASKPAAPRPPARRVRPSQQAALWEVLQLKAAEKELRATEQAEAVPEAPSRGSLPARLRTGIEQLSGLAMDDVRVHRDSPEPAGLGALAFARGSDIHLGPGQEAHLPHEAWHVVQQKRGRVSPTLQMQGAPLNDSRPLEREADAMAARLAAAPPAGQQAVATRSAAAWPVIQRVVTSNAALTPLDREDILARLTAARYQIRPEWIETIDDMIARGNHTLDAGEEADFVAALNDPLQRRLTALGQESPWYAKLKVKVSIWWQRLKKRLPGQRRASAEDIKEINNWVAGGGGPLNVHAQGRETANAREIRSWQLARSVDNEVGAFPLRLEDRLQGMDRALNRLPASEGTTYRHATYRDAETYSNKIRPGAYISTPGYFATSRLKGAASGIPWGTGKKVYFEVTGATGIDLTSHQSVLGSEKEVVYPRESVFKVLAVRVTGGTVRVILETVGREEVPPDEEILDPYSGNPRENEQQVPLNPDSDSDDDDVPGFDSDDDQMPDLDLDDDQVRLLIMDH